MSGFSPPPGAAVPNGAGPVAATAAAASSVTAASGWPGASADTARFSQPVRAPRGSTKPDCRMSLSRKCERDRVGEAAAGASRTSPRSAMAATCFSAGCRPKSVSKGRGLRIASAPRIPA
jgi:hypothetical protein